MCVCGEYLLERGDGEGLEVETPRVASVEWFGVAEEHPVHESVYAAAEHEVDVGLAVQFVPDAGDLAVDLRGGSVEFLKFVHDERKRGGDGLFHDEAENVGESFDAPWHGASEDAGDFTLEVFADGRLRRTGDEEVEEWHVASVVERLADEFRLADAPPPRHDCHAGCGLGKIADCAKFLKFGCSAEEFHFAIVLLC